MDVTDVTTVATATEVAPSLLLAKRIVCLDHRAVWNTVFSKPAALLSCVSSSISICCESRTLPYIHCIYLPSQLKLDADILRLECVYGTLNNHDIGIPNEDSRHVEMKLP